MPFVWKAAAARAKCCRVWFLAGLAGLGWAVAAPLAEPALAGSKIALSDDFDRAPIDRSKWSLYRMGDRRHWIDRRVVRDGAGALAIRIKGNDFDPNCGCQMSEIREAVDQRLPFGEEAWYAFSFRVDGRGPVIGDQRWQIGGWKQESDGSPFVAQRFDNGVFHITLESGESRVLVATAEGEATSFFALLRDGIMSQFTFLSEPSKFDGREELRIEYGDDPILPDPRRGWVDMVYRIKGGLKGDGVVEVYANGRFIARAMGTIGIANAQGSLQYFRFGHNRAPMPGTATIYLDRFRRGASQAEVEN